MVKEHKVELSLIPEFYDAIKDLIKRIPWLAYESPEEFMIAAIRIRYENLLSLEASLKGKR